MKEISIIIPCYNDGHFIERAIESVNIQTFKNWELIIVNDGSNVIKTLEILEKLSVRGIKVINQTHQGLPTARNTGIAAALGEFILPLDADDWLEASFLERTIEVIKSDTSIIAVSSYVRRHGLYDNVREMAGGSIESFVNNCDVVACALFRRASWVKLGGYDEEMTSGYEDWEFWIRLLSEGGQINIIPEPLFNYFVKAYSLSLKSNENRADIVAYMVNKNAVIFQKYAIQAIIGREALIKKLTIQQKQLLDQFKSSTALRLGSLLLAPAKFLNSLTKLILNRFAKKTS